MKDFFRETLNINDKVVFMSQIYKRFRVGTITKFTKEFVDIKNKFDCNCKHKSNRVIKITEQQYNSIEENGYSNEDRSF